MRIHRFARRCALKNCLFPGKNDTVFGMEFFEIPAVERLFVMEILDAFVRFLLSCFVLTQSIVLFCRTDFLKMSCYIRFLSLFDTMKYILFFWILLVVFRTFLF